MVCLSKDVKDVATEPRGHVRVRQREQLMQRSGDGNVPCVLRGIKEVSQDLPWDVAVYGKVSPSHRL